MTQTKRIALLQGKSQPVDPRALGQVATMAGFDGIELSADDMRCRDVATADSQITVGAVFATRRVGSLEEATDELSQRLHDAAAVGARCMNLTILPPTEDSEAASDQDTLNFIYSLVRAVRLEAESSGVAVALEAGTTGPLRSPMTMREIIDAANSWAVGVCIDVETIASFGNAADWIAALHRRIHSIRLRAESNSDDGAATPRIVDPLVIADTLDRIRYDRIIIATGNCEPQQMLERLEPVFGARREKISGAASR